ncbi:EAL domain-containing protein [bacterium]|nr:EAL domain-containing protein [bacterium]
MCAGHSALSIDAVSVILSVVDKIYAISSLLLSLWIYDYGTHGLYPRSDASFFIKITAAVSLLFFPVNIIYDNGLILLSGLHRTLSCIMSFILILSLICVTIKKRELVNIRKVVCLSIWFVMWVVASFLRDIFSTGSYVCFVCAIGMFLLFYYVENPAARVDKETRFFTVYFMKEYISSIQYSGRPICVGVIYSDSGYFDLSLIRTFEQKSIHCFKDSDSFFYFVGYTEGTVNSVLNDYFDVDGDAVGLLYHYSHDVDINTFMSYVKSEAHLLECGVVHRISSDDICSIADENKVRMEIVHALVEDRVLAYIQPIYNIKEDKFTSGECLCRLKRSNGEIMYPNSFISIAEKTGLIVDIETAMLKNLCKCLSDSRLKDSHIKYLDVNLSIKKGEKRNLVDEYSAILEDYKISADMVNLEITETDVVREKMFLLDNMNQMREQGFHFSLDDFGTGESNLGYIIDMPVSIIKFDKEITQKAMVDAKAFSIVKNVIKMAHDLSISVVVEGVETEADLNVCRDIDADFVQGYYFSKPLPMDEFIAFVSNN